MKANQLIPMILAGISASAFAQEGQQGPPPRGHHPDLIAIVLDTDHDHELSAEEIADASEALLKLDKDGDGALSEDELKPKPRRGGQRRERKSGEEREKRPAPPKSELFKAIDTDDDGAFSKEEIAAAAESLKALDENEDGKLDDTEVKSLARPPRQGPPDGEGEGGEGRGRRGPRR